MKAVESVKKEIKKIEGIRSEELQGKLLLHLADVAKAINDLNNTFDSIKKEVLVKNLNKTR